MGGEEDVCAESGQEGVEVGGGGGRYRGDGSWGLGELVLQIGVRGKGERGREKGYRVFGGLGLWLWSEFGGLGGGGRSGSSGALRGRG